MMRAKYLFPELILAVWAQLLRRDLVSDGHPLLLFMLLPYGFLIQLSCLSLSVHIANLLHLKALLEVLKLIEVLFL